MSNNSLSGMIPQCLTAIRNISVLNLARNNLTGTISNVEVSKDSSLEVLEIGRNRLGGQVPKSLAKCTELKVLNMGNNNITDSFPCLLKSISTLRVLVLRSNNFYGGIECLNTNGTWPGLQIIDLAHNNFRGEIQGILWRTWQKMMVTEDGFQLTIKGQELRRIYNSDRMSLATNRNGFKEVSLVFEYGISITVTNKGSEMNLVKILSIFTLIDFSCNNFSGPIPKEMGELKSLHALNLSRNAFTGEIPSSFGNMSALECLDLSQNKLSGHIPPQLGKLTFLSFLNLSNNQLVGRIPTSTQFSTFPKASFTGNKGLWGPPLTVDNKAGLSPPPTVNGRPPNSGHNHEVNWDLISVEIGFTLGFGVAIGSLVFCKRWSKWYYRAVYNILLKIFPQLEERIGIHRRHVHINQRWWRR
ncbi:receptor like protein 30-like [Prunus avium]|uniref:Receptor like protein 30-like n=1 Tax=Prunus avium TaxID=42229 RepID=A0A6P5TXI6_PRUAV|nr:receptor like protein 30-like [Prunus avium]